ncbi:hypothetical protein K8R61_02765 [bacterium]|nr:hypothetical protein [bacterium]
MKCYKHNTVDAVASCSQGCGRSLCSDCTEKYDVPLCDFCAASINQIADVELEEDRTSIKKRMIINTVILVGFAIVAIAGGITSNPPDWVMIFGIPIIYWGFTRFKRLFHAFLIKFNLTIFSSVGKWIIFYLIGGMITGILAPFVIPFLIYRDVKLLKTLPKKDVYSTSIKKG